MSPLITLSMPFQFHHHIKHHYFCSFNPHSYRELHAGWWRDQHTHIHWHMPLNQSSVNVESRLCWGRLVVLSLSFKSHSLNLCLLYTSAKLTNGSCLFKTCQHANIPREVMVVYSVSTIRWVHSYSIVRLLQYCTKPWDTNFTAQPNQIVHSIHS